MRTKYNILFILSLCINLVASAQVITTYAGTGTAGYSGDGGLATKAELNIPYGVAIDKDGNLYIVDNPNNRIRKVDAITHVITTVVGLGTNGGNCPLKEAGLQNPRGIAFDKKGNLYITDASTCVRKVDFAAQTITTIAGIRGQSNTYGNVVGDGGPALKGYFDGAAGIAIDDAGNIFVADYVNFRVRRIDAVTGIITTYAGGSYNGDDGEDKPATDAQVAFPFGVAFDSKGNLYISQVNVIRKVNPNTNTISVVAGKIHNGGYGGDGEPAMGALLNNPAGIAFDKYDNLYIADELNNRIRKIDNKTGVISTIAGTGVAGYAGDCDPAVKALLNWPVGITADAARQVYFTEQNNNTVRKIGTAQDSMITGAPTICLRDSIRLTALEPGGNWLSSNPAVASVNENGVVKGVSTGSAIITYTINSGGCAVITSNHTVTVNGVNEDAAIVSSKDLCVRSADNLKASSVNGYWYSNDAGTVKTDSTGNIQCLKYGVAVLRYLVNATCTVTDKVSIQVFSPHRLFLGNDTSICSNQPLTINAGSDFVKYRWNTSDTTQSIAVSQAGIYGIEATDAHTCVSTDSIVVQTLDPPVFNWPVDSAFCEDDKLVLYAPSNTSALTWQDGTSASSFTVTQAGNYSLIASGANGCTDTATIKINKVPLPVFTLGPDTALCTPNVLSYDFNIPNASYLWSSGSLNNVYSVNKEGVYWLTINQRGCAASDTVNVMYKQAPVIHLGNDTTLCQNTTLLLNVDMRYTAYLWQDGSTNTNYLVTKPGKYFVIVSANNCTASDTISIEYIPLPVFTLGADTFLCKGETLKLEPPTNAGAHYTWQDGSRQPFYNVTDPGLYSLKVSNQCGFSSDSVTVSTGMCSLIMPSAFTPNGDGLNDVFRVRYIFPVKQFSMVVYNRWGEKIFQSKDISKGWNGSFKGLTASMDTYIWVIAFIDNDNRKQTQHGTVILIR